MSDEAKTLARNRRMPIRLSIADVAALRRAASSRLDELGEFDMDDEELRRLVRRISECAERHWHITYEWEF